MKGARHDNYETLFLIGERQKVFSMNNKKEIFEKIAEAKDEVLLGDVVKVLRALNEDIDNVIEVKSKS